MKTASLTLIVIGVLVGCSTSSEAPSLTFIRAVSQKLSLDKELLFELDHSKPFAAPTYVVKTPLKGGAADLGAWQLSCQVRSGNGGEAKVWLSEGKELKPNLTPERTRSGKALVAAAERLILEDRLRFPFMLRTRKTSNGWSFLFTQIPDVIGSDVSVRASNDLTVVDVMEGH